MLIIARTTAVQTVVMNGNCNARVGLSWNRRTECLTLLC